MQADKIKVKKVKVSTLTGPLLNYWVGKADNKKVRIIPSGSYPYDDRETEIFFHREADGYLYPGTIGLITSDTIPEYSPSTDWSQGGLIIENEKIKLEPIYSTSPEWRFVEWRAKSLLYRFEMSGPTALIAAMRYYVANRIGEEVDEI